MNSGTCLRIYELDFHQGIRLSVYVKFLSFPFFIFPFLSFRCFPFLFHSRLLQKDPNTTLNPGNRLLLFSLAWHTRLRIGISLLFIPGIAYVIGVNISIAFSFMLLLLLLLFFLSNDFILFDSSLRDKELIPTLYPSFSFSFVVEFYHYYCYYYLLRYFWLILLIWYAAFTSVLIKIQMVIQEPYFI